MLVTRPSGYLLRVEPGERLQFEEPTAARRASLERLLGAYLTLAERAATVLEPSGLERFGSDPARGRRADHPMAATVEGDPLGWFKAERSSMIAAVEQACHAGLWEPAWRLADVLGGFFQLHAHWDDWQHTHVLELTAARRAGDRDAEGCIPRQPGRPPRVSVPDTGIDTRSTTPNAACSRPWRRSGRPATGVGSCKAC
jgi:hypothetical protein